MTFPWRIPRQEKCGVPRTAKTLEQKFRSGDVFRIVLLLVSVSLFSVCVCAARCSNVCTDPKLGTEWHDDDRRPWRRKGELSPWLPAGKPVTQGSLMLSLSIVRRSLWIVVSGRILSWADIWSFPTRALWVRSVLVTQDAGVDCFHWLDGTNSCLGFFLALWCCLVNKFKKMD